MLVCVSVCARSLHETGGRVQRNRRSGGGKSSEELVFQSISSDTVLEWEFNRSNRGQGACGESRDERRLDNASSDGGCPFSLED